MYSAHSNILTLALSHNYATPDSTRLFGHFDHEAPRMSTHKLDMQPGVILLIWT
jgi:hypothetical protein